MEREKYSEHVAARIVLKDAVPLRKPLTVYIEATSVCNFKCSICTHSLSPDKQPRSKSHMSMDLFTKIVDDFKSWEGDKIKTLYPVYGGEALLNPHFSEMLKIIKQADIGKKTELVTNASMLTDEKIRALIENQLDFLRISIYAVNQQKHEKITGSNIDVNHIYDNICRLKALRDKSGSVKPFIYIKMINSYSDDNQLFFSRYSQLADEIRLEDVFNWNDYDNTRYHDYIRAAYDAEAAKATENKYLSMINNEKMKCHQPFYHMNISASGDIYVCCSDWANEIKVGNASESSLKDIWFGERFENVRRRIIRGEQNSIRACRNCTLYKLSHYESDNIDSLTEDEYLKRWSERSL